MAKRTDTPKVGDIVPYWFAPEGTMVMEVRPYTGRYPEWFRFFVKLQHLGVRRGYVETVWP